MVSIDSGKQRITGPFRSRVGHHGRLTYRHALPGYQQNAVKPGAHGPNRADTGISPMVTNKKQVTFLVALSLVAAVGMVIDMGLSSSFSTPWAWVW